MSALRRLICALSVAMALAFVLTPPAAAGPFEDAFAAYNRGDYKTAFRGWKPLAEGGNASAQTWLGFLYERGDGVAKDEAESLRWYRKANQRLREAAERGHPSSQNDLGFMYSNGRGVAKDEAEAVRWYRKAADQGYATAQFNLGAMYETGRGVAKDEVEAMRWYRKATDQGFARAQFNLGAMHERGSGVAKDEAEAVRWYRKAADQGYAWAQTNLARLEGQLRRAEAAAEERRRVEQAEARRRAEESRQAAEERRRVAQAETRRRAEEARRAEEEEKRQRLARLTEGLVPADVVTPIMNDGVNLRALPEPEADVVKQLAKGRQVQVTGVLPSGWLRIAEEGRPVGWIFKTSVAPSALAAISPGGARSAPVAAAAEVVLEPLDAPFRVRSSANVRAAPDVTSARVAGLLAGERVTVLARVRDEDWFLVDGEGSALVSFSRRFCSQCALFRRTAMRWLSSSATRPIPATRPRSLTPTTTPRR